MLLLLAAALALPAAALSIAGCGLEFPILLASPAQAELGTDSLFPFVATSANVEPEFKGFEVYYKIYVPPASDSERYFDTQYSLAQAGFRRLTSASDNIAFPQTPLLPVASGDRGKVFTVTVDFGDPSNPTIYDDGTPLTPVGVAVARRSIIRGAPYANQFKPFNEWDSTDADISPTIYNDYIHTTFPTPVVLRLFALSYGFDASGALYSIPVWIGDGNITFIDVD